MPEYKAPMADMQYLLTQVFDAESIWQAIPAFSHCNAELATTVLDEGAKICQQLIAPINRPGDEEGVSMEDGNVKTAAGYQAAFRTFAENGWMSLGGNPDYDGQGLPKMLTNMFDEMVNAASPAFCLYSNLTSGAAFCINAHASDTLKQRYLPNMYTGQWTGAMALTESHAGTDLGLIRTKADPQADGSYLLTGQKIFITGGDHDLSENIIHLVLAKLPDAPAGPKGISLFLAPKYKVNDDGSLGERNAFSCGSLEEKMGLHASSTCVMNYDAAEAFLIGEVNQGLNAMFTMMNYERVFVGVQGLSMAQLSYQGAVEYAKDRVQSRAPGSSKEGIADAIIDHGDVRRMLMTQKAYIEACRAFAVYTGMQLDKTKSSDGAEAERAEKLVALLTPIVKAFLTDKGFELAVMGQQVLGGHGYIREWGMEQIVRDARINQIYEGTNGIQAMDLIGRKVLANQGEYLIVYLTEINDFIDEISKKSKMMPFSEALKFASNTVEQVTKAIFSASNTDPHMAGTAANDYLQLLGLLSCSYMWAKMADVSIDITQGDTAVFHDGKIKTGLFFIQRLLPQISALAMAITQGAQSTMALDLEQF
ncbi:MAG: acyl-CoA dehydrogenase C-terminal domain-containing protein [Pseudomonadales bacterium]|nr:acyl-CoA dehydrogenase C-terminal domain-containing protein [Pseudomonadales bacterium]